MIQKSYLNNIACCYIVPTPIGNMGDITKRAVEVLTSVDVIFAEDTRVTQNLLNILGIKKKIVECQKFNESKASDEALRYLSDEKNIAIVTDRGTPLISDPGSLVVSNIIKNNYNVIALPGACAFIPALNMSNLDQSKFLFYGFLNSKESQSLKELESLKNIKFTIVLYEAPHRLYKTLQNIYKIMGNRDISISREITKVYEEVFRGNVSEAFDIYNKDIKGEFVIVIDKSHDEVSIEKAYSDLIEVISYGMNSKDAIKYISKKDDISKNLLYNMYEERKK